MQNTPHEIVITILPDGKITGTVVGVEGPHCGPLSQWLDELGKVEEDSQTADYRKQGRQTINLKQ